MINIIFWQRDRVYLVSNLADTGRSTDPVHCLSRDYLSAIVLQEASIGINLIALTSSSEAFLAFFPVASSILYPTH